MLGSSILLMFLAATQAAPAPAPSTPPPPATATASTARSPPTSPPATAPRKSGNELRVPAPRSRPPEIPSYVVSVKLRTGRRFAGVVTRDRGFHQLVGAAAHRSPEVYARPDRFTLRFVDGLDGQVELAWNQVAKLEVRDVLDFAGLKTMEARFQTARIERRALEIAAVTAPPVPSDAGSEPTPSAPATPEPSAPEKSAPEGTKPADKPVSKPQVEPLPGLLAEFPPDQGWSAERKQQIELRRTVTGAAPDAREARFLEVFEEWKTSWQEWAATEAARKRDEPAPAEKHAPETPANPKGGSGG